MKTTGLSNNPITPGNFRPLRRLCGLAIAAIGLGASIPSAQAVDYVAATGGTITNYQVGATVYTVHTFTGDGTFTVTSASGGSVNYLVIGGGGGGGGSTGGGGGAGGFLESTATVTGGNTAYAVTVGAGGAGGTGNGNPEGFGTNGDNSAFGSFATAIGGGGGAPNGDSGSADGNPGGSGGGGSYVDNASVGGAATAGQGNAGGACLDWGGPYTPGGGGGAGAVGTDGNRQDSGADGGAGLSSTIADGVTATWYAGGGGGGNFFGNSGGTGGSGIGGHGGQGAFGGSSGWTSGSPNTGSGGGGQGGNNAAAAGSGGSGIVIISYASGTSSNPYSTNATLAALENTEIALTASNFGYVDPGSVALAAVQITSLPVLGTLKNSGATVVSGDLPLTVSAANIGNLTYQSPSGGGGSPYTTMGIKVQNANTLWSFGALMTVNVTHVNQPPTSTGGSVILRKNAVKTFAAADFEFSDIDGGDTLGGIKVTSLPTHGTLTLSASAVTLNQVVAVADITAGNLIYTPSTDYTGSDPFNFQVRDATLFSADATMAISVTTDIIVQNGSFETHGGDNAASYWWSLGSPWVGGQWVDGHATDPYEELQVNQFDTFTAAADGLYAANLDFYHAPFTQDLSTTVQAGDTLSMTFFGGRDKSTGGGKFTATFKVGTTEYTSNVFDTGLQANDTWQSYTLTKTITNTGNLSIIFSNVNDGDKPWLDNISNISVTSGSGPTPGSYADWALTNAPGQDPDQDYNNDGVLNGVAYFMGVTGQATNHGLDASNTVTWPASGTFSGTYKVQTSPDLSTWTDVDPQPTPSGGNLTYTLPSDAPGGTSFVRLKVTPN